MLRDEIAKYTELSGNDGEHTPIGIIGAYLDGYEKGLKSRENKGEWVFDEILDKHYYCSECKSMGVSYWDYCPYCGAKMKGGE